MHYRNFGSAHIYFLFCYDGVFMEQAHAHKSGFFI